MGQRYPDCTALGVTKVLRREGFIKVSQKGSHQKWQHADGRIVIVPFSGHKSLRIGTLRNIIKGSKLPVNLFR